MVNERIAITIMGGRFFSQNARPSDVGIPYAESATIAVDMLRRGANRVQIDYDLAVARNIKQQLHKNGIIK